jgi:CAAX protease family protein
MSTTARAVTPATRIAAPQVALLCTGIAAAALLRGAVGGADPAASVPAAVLFAAALLVLTRAAGWRPGRMRARDAALGIAGAGMLLGAWFMGGGRLLLDAPAHATALAWWTPLVVIVAVAEEMALRGALFTALLRWKGTATAIIVTSLLFGLIHVPLYGWQALPLDAAAGVVLGGLRVLSGGVAAPAVAHALTDLAAGWLG